MALPLRLLFRAAPLKNFGLATGVRPLATEVVKKEDAPVAQKTEKKEKKGIIHHLGEHHIPAGAGKMRTVPADFKEFPERDVKNYPHPNMLEFPSKTRLYMIPDSWFRFFYEKTGETGGYLFMGGLALFMVQKELYVITEPLELFFGPQIACLFIYHLLFGRQLGEFFHNRVDDLHDSWSGWQDAQKHNISVHIEAEKEIQGMLQGQMDQQFVAMRENLMLQAESTYRQRVKTVHEKVKRQLDFLSEYENTKRRFELRHMADWVVDQVRASVTPQLEAAALQQCVVDLKALASKK